MEDTEAEPDEIPPALTIALTKPIEFRGIEYLQIELSEPTAGQAAKAELRLGKNITPQTMREHDICLMADVSGVPEPVIKMLPISKFAQGAAYLSRFERAGRQIGEKS